MPDHTLIEEVTYRLHCLKQDLLYAADPRGRESRRSLGALRDRHRGERCFILGNGPSLRQTDLSRLRGEFTFGLNRVYLLFPELGFATTYLVAVNQLVIDQCAAELASVPATQFYPWTARRAFPEASGIVYLRNHCARPHFATDARKPVWTGATVTYVAMQLAYHIGFQEVVLVGVDHAFTTQGKPHEEVVSQGDDPNHFASNYFGAGFRWQLPDLETSEIAYRMARGAFEADGRRILDATLGGRLAVFPKVDYDSIF